ncbi:hypothetical protein BDV12DRAFT_166030 [Aspergillus spectabilis]
MEACKITMCLVYALNGVVLTGLGKLVCAPGQMKPLNFGSLEGGKRGRRAKSVLGSPETGGGSAIHKTSSSCGKYRSQG